MTLDDTLLGVVIATGLDVGSLASTTYNLS
jgi:hypothetical protein